MATVTINRLANSSNLPPSQIGDGESTIPYSTELIFSRDLLTSQLNPPYIDPENDSAENFRVNTLPERGVLKLRGIDVSIGDIIPFSDIDDSFFIYESDLTDTDGDQVSFTFSISDEGSKEYTTNLATYTINIDPDVTNTFTFRVDHTGESNSIKSFRFIIENYQGNVEINWGDLVETVPYNNDEFSHTYSVEYVGDVSITYNASNNRVRLFSDSTGTPSKRMRLDENLNTFSVLPELEVLILFSGVITGNLEVLPPSLKNLSISTTNDVAGNIMSLSLDTIEEIIITGNNTISGDISNGFSKLDRITITGNNTISGNLDNFENIRVINITGNNTISGNLDNINSSRLESILITGNNTISGIHTLLSFQDLLGIRIEGNNTISGDIENIQFPDSFIITGNNTITGDLNNITIPRTFRVEGNNTITGDLNSVSPINSGLIRIEGDSHLVTGNFTGLKKLYSVILNGTSTSNISVGMSGDIGLIDETDIWLGNNDNWLDIESPVSGNLSYTSKNWNAPIANSYRFLLRLFLKNPSFALNPNELDQLLIDLDNSNIRKNTSVLEFTNGFSRTSASDTAFNNLISDNMTIIIN